MRKVIKMRNDDCTMDGLMDANDLSNELEKMVNAMSIAETAAFQKKTERQGIKYMVSFFKTYMQTIGCSEMFKKYTKAKLCSEVAGRMVSYDMAERCNYAEFRDYLDDAMLYLTTHINDVIQALI